MLIYVPSRYAVRNWEGDFIPLLSKGEPFLEGMAQASSCKLGV